MIYLYVSIATITLWKHCPQLERWSTKGTTWGIHIQDPEPLSQEQLILRYHLTLVVWLRSDFTDENIAMLTKTNKRPKVMLVNETALPNYLREAKMVASAVGLHLLSAFLTSIGTYYCTFESREHVVPSLYVCDKRYFMSYIPPRNKLRVLSGANPTRWILTVLTHVPNKSS